MSYSIIQTPAVISLSQSPMIIAVSSSTLTTQTNFQYVGELSVWTGSANDSSSAQTWVLAKYPSTQGRTGIFDISRIVNSTQTELAQQNSSSLANYKFETYSRYQSGSSYITGSHITFPDPATYGFQAAKAIDGYQLFPETIGQELNTLTPLYPFLYDGPATQSVLIDNIGYGYLFTGLGQLGITSLLYTNQNGLTASLAPSAGEGIVNFPIAPAQPGFPLNTSGLTSYTILAFSGANPLGSMKFEIVCPQKYPNRRIKFKNRFGVLQYINMGLVSRESFTSEKRTYQPQLGSWSGRTLSYNEYDSQTLNYIADSKQGITCNTDYVEESYNEIFKQLLVSNEIYLCIDNTEEVKPLTIATSNISFKTGVVDKLIQYTFDFNFGQGYKLII